MYEVLVSFSDNDDNGFVYWVGMAYPRAGYEPTKERILHLQGSKNTMGKPIISKKARKE